ncbi:hypothetical protein D9615_002175 [Tricholomella constricta]|uniref:DNA-(apurinic or apyrimidinic site) endonuclease 2 n=1 Tax=Tricholomella constricta TaxID=117010 RepID=A0A8H5M9X0_9AGAR|nr:hypothetical protein D9615_002175 [Tricholomella constricta]
MRILTWNINGVRTLPQYYPWNTFSSFNDILDALEADILCFQEMKTSRSGLTRITAVPPSYNAFFSFPIQKSGYSGVATHVRTTAAVPVKAEEGLCGIIQPKPPFSAEERISRLEAYPQRVIADGHEDDSDEEGELDYKDLDSEGRTLVLDFGLFVLINVYCPNDGNGTEERDKYKADFHKVLEARVRGLVELEGREVIVVGDLNACAAVIDHCEGRLMVAKGLAEGLQDEEGFWGKNVRRWLRAWMVAEDGTGGPMVDITRQLWPDRKAMFTCWNTKISARESNYGTRIDYILITRGLLPWVKAADIQPEVKGSDHCPVYLDLHDEIVDSSGAVIKLQDALGFKQGNPSEPPRISSKFWNEYSGKQRLLQQFFGKNVTPPSTGCTPSKPIALERSDNAPVPTSTTHASSGDVDIATPSSSRDLSRDTSMTDDDASTRPSPKPMLTQRLSGPSQSMDYASEGPSSSSPALKRKLTADTLTRSSLLKKQKQKKEQEKTPGQAKLSSFFTKPKNSNPSTATTSSSSKQKLTFREPDTVDSETIEIDLEADHRLAMLLSSQETDTLKPCGNETAEAKQAWSSLLAPMQAPKCLVHGEPTKELTVMKPGPNKGKKFFICAR